MPNWLTLGITLTGLALATARLSGLSLGAAFAGFLLGLAVMLPGHLIGATGAGDVKLLAAVGACVGPWTAVWVALFASIAGGVMALLVASYSGYLRKAFVNLWCIVMYWRIEGPRPVPELTLSTHKGPRLAYAVPVLAGVMLTLWLR